MFTCLFIFRNYAPCAQDPSAVFDDDDDEDDDAVIVFLFCFQMVLQNAPE